MSYIGNTTYGYKWSIAGGNVNACGNFELDLFNPLRYHYKT